MRRIMLTAVASVAVLALVPASALASHHHKRHHKRSHHARVHHARERRFGHVSSSSTQPSTPMPTPTAVGTVASFTNGVLTIKLNDNSTVSGAVTGDTEIECRAAEEMGNIHEDGDGGDHGGGDNHGGNGSGDNGDNDNGEHQGDENQSCGTAALTPGAMVEGAELRLSSAGSTWDKVELIG